ncbi:MAG: proline dehydrogenase family protein [Bacteroidota bacterium]
MNVLNKLIVAAIPVVPKPIIRHFANRYIAGEEITDAVQTVKKLNAEGCSATLDVLGEDITERHEATASRDKILEVLQTINKENLESNVSLKPTQLGLKLDKNFCLENAKMILQIAKDLNNFVRLDMEDSSCTDDIIWLYRELRKDFSNTGIVLQAYLRRTSDDAIKLMKAGYGNFRFCKGIYIEPEAIAFKQPDEINANFISVLNTMWDMNAYVGVATHDDKLVDAAHEMIAARKLQKNEFEFQMLLGVRPELRKKLVREGFKVRIYVPFGKHWYRYSIRRFKENPQMAGYVFKAIFSGFNSN